MSSVSLYPRVHPAALAKDAPERCRMLSSGQYRLWFLDQLTPGSSAYNITDMVRIHGALDVPALRAALNAIVDRHEVLRTNFVAPQGMPVLVVANSRPVDFNIVDLTRLPVAERESTLARGLANEAARPFDLSKDVMLRVVLFRVAAGEHVLFHNSHHIAWDLRSKFVFYRELSEFYRAVSRRETVRLSPLPLQYSDFAVWEHRRLQAESLETLTSYWKRQLAGAARSLEIPTDFPRPKVLNYKAGPRVPIVLETALLSDLAKSLPPRRLPLAKALLWAGISPFHTLLAAFNILMYTYSGQSDILVSSPYGNRGSSEFQELIGFFPNTMILRSHVSAGQTFQELTTGTFETVHDAVQHAGLPFDKIVESARPARYAGQLPLVQVNFRIQRAPVPVLNLCGLALDLPEWVDNGASKFDLALELVMTPSLKGYFEYQAGLFEQATVRQMVDDFQALLREVLQTPDVPIGTMNTVRQIQLRVRPDAVNRTCRT